MPIARYTHKQCAHKMTQKSSFGKTQIHMQNTPTHTHQHTHTPKDRDRNHEVTDRQIDRKRRTHEARYAHIHQREFEFTCRITSICRFTKSIQSIPLSIGRAKEMERTEEGKAEAHKWIVVTHKYVSI